MYVNISILCNKNEKKNVYVFKKIYMYDQVRSTGKRNNYYSLILDRDLQLDLMAIFRIIEL